ncbi:MAG: nucleotide exchange factor GrpE [Patescibacteria group bacterium]|nr:nucleotide exchange factor GrpE [Patescibacteria group bacterium]
MKDLKQACIEGKQETAKMKDQLLRTLAEFDNYKKRTEREYQNLIFTASASLVKELLPVIDDLDRSLTVTNNHQDPVQFRKGIQLIYDKFMKILETRGVQPINAVGQPFDTEKHEALMQVEKTEYPSNTVVEVYQKGFTMHDKILRHAKVIVNK